MNLTLHALKLDDKTFERIVKANPEWNFEQTAQGELIIVPPTGGTSGRKNLSLSGQFNSWVENNLELGVGFDSSTLFTLPSGAKRSPDASWIRKERWDALTRQQQDGYPPLCPDFVVELRSPTDNLEDLRVNVLLEGTSRSCVDFVKMQEYMDNGALLGWLINPQDRQVEIYRPLQQVKILQSPSTLSGEEVLPGFVLSLQRIFV